MLNIRIAFLTYLMPILTMFLLFILFGIAVWNFTQLDTIYDEIKKHQEMV